MDTVRGKGMRLILSLMLVTALVAVSTAMIGCGTDEPADDADTGAAVDAEPIEIGWVAWDECIAVSWLWKDVLEEQGYEVELTQLDIAPVYSGLATGDLDLYLDAWLPITHGDYADEYGDSWEYIGVWYDKGLLTWAVPEYVEAQSIADLADQADTFDSRIVGIDPGAGLMRISKNDVMPGYGLEDWELVEGSTPAMLAELERAVNDEEPIVVTLWRPHWAYGAYPVRDLEDPQGLLGEAEELHVVAHEGFSEEYPEVAEWLSTWEMDDDSVGSLVDTVINEYGQGQEAEAVDAWLSDPDNRALVDSWLEG